MTTRAQAAENALASVRAEGLVPLAGCAVPPTAVRQVGNAVPPLLARALGEHFAKAFGWKLDEKRFIVNEAPARNRMTLAERLERRTKYMRGGASRSSPELVR